MRGNRTRSGATLMDRRIIGAAAVVVAVFVVANNLLFNYRGFAEHVRFITGDARMVRGFDLFDAMPIRRLQVLASTAHSIFAAWGGRCCWRASADGSAR